MVAFIVKRLAAALVVVMVVSFVIFSCMYLAPGGPEQAILGPTSATPETLARIRLQYGLDDPFLVQYWRFITNAATFDFGRSYQTGETVAGGIWTRLGISLPLALGGFVLSVIVGLVGGVVSAHRQGRPIDRILGAVSIGAASIPAYASAIFLLFVFGVQLRWFPIGGDGEGVADRASRLVLPIIALGLVGAATILRRTRVAMIAALERDDVAFAQARGVPARDILLRYTLRHSAVIILTSVSVILIFMLAGTAVVETAFGLNGVGAYLITAINTKDLPSVLGIAVTITILVVLVNLATDFLYAVIDPRIQRGMAPQ
ncbi:ABC transporter permease [Rhodococcus wratislaviensis]|uniref:Putative ABC transporter permease protein n=1 Tax=Rhodococcus wratislaviensis NBRC 100605 TaxID=1219028 RepID=X0PMA4_RHOWR|nr:ABC transporter permease [Rhodococcus wratislaviensis]GAF43679.1 putative ABC transporter permease protein [Rhodococcus wratislaviensis NBRC 100605]